MVSKDTEVNKVKLRIKKLKRLRGPCPIIFGIAIYGIFIDKTDAFHPVFNLLINDKRFAYGLLSIACGVEATVMIKLLPLVRLKNKLSNE